jgi:hypothetical protein
VPRQRSRPPQPGRPQQTSRGRARRLSRHAALALLLAAPLIFLAVTAHDRGFVSPNVRWIVNRETILTSGPGLSKLGYGYPPLPVLLAVIVPGGEFGLAICTCLFSGLIGSLLIRRVGLSRGMLLALPLIAVPQMWFFASELIAQVLSLAFLAVAVFGFFEFASYGQTYGGFVAGLALAASYTADPGALLYALVMCLFVPLLGTGRFQGDWHGPVATCAVIAFPVVATAACWSFLVWKMSGHWPGDLHYAPGADLFGFPHGVLGGIGPALASAFGDLARSTVYIAVAVLLCVRRRTVRVGVGMLLPALALALALWLGFDYSPINSFYLFTLLAIAVVANHDLLEGDTGRTVILIAAVAQVIIGIKLLPPTPGFTVWQHLMFQ